MSHKVILAEDGEHAIALFKKHDPDVVLLGARMSVMDGFQVVRTLREIDNGWRPILFLSNAIDNKSFESGINAGADDYLFRPIDKIILKAKLHTMERLVAMRKKRLELSNKLAKEKDKNKKLAHQNGLTGIANRRLLDSVMDHEFRRIQRSG